MSEKSGSNRADIGCDPGELIFVPGNRCGCGCGSITLWIKIELAVVRMSRGHVYQVTSVL